MFLLRSKIRDALANRALRIKTSIDESNQRRKAAQQRFEELESRLEGFESELASMKADAVAKSEADHKMIVERASADAERIAEAAQRSIRDETERAARAATQVAELSVDLLEKVVEDGEHGRPVAACRRFRRRGPGNQ